MSASTGSNGVSIIYKDIQDPRVKEYFKKAHDKEKGAAKDPEGVLTAKGMGISDAQFRDWADLAIQYVYAPMETVKYQDGNSTSSVSVVDGKLVLASSNINHLAHLDFNSYIVIIDKESKSWAWVVWTKKPVDGKILAEVEKHLMNDGIVEFSGDPSLPDVLYARCVWKSPDGLVLQSSYIKDGTTVKDFIDGTFDFLIVHGTNEQKIILSNLRKQIMNEVLFPKEKK